MIDIAKIITGKESVNVEVKSADSGVPSSVWETYSSFANTFGGTIVLGIGENKKTKEFIPKGVENPHQLILDIWNTLNNRQKISANILLEHQVYSVEYEGRDYVVLEIPRADRSYKPVFVGQDMFKGSFKRNQEGDYHCTKEEIKAMIRDQSDTSADSYVLDKVSIKALNSESINSYRNMFRLYHDKHFWNDLPVEDFLIKIGAAKIAEIDGKIHPTLGGLIFFGDFMSITDELPYFFLDYREVLPGSERWSDRVCSGDADWSGNVYDFFFRIAHRITSDVKRPFKLDENMLRIDDTPIHKGIRECLANALIHADYYGRRGVVIVRELNKITISNPGSFRIDLNEAISGGISDTRNTKIFNMFALIDVGERAGTGLCNVFNVWKQYGYSEPVITESVNPDRIIMVININDNDTENGANSSENGANSSENGANSSENVANSSENVANLTENVANSTENVANSTENVANSESFSKCDRAVYEYMLRHSTSSVSEIAGSIGFTTRSVQRSIIKFENIGLVKKNGNRSNRIWVLESSTDKDS